MWSVISVVVSKGEGCFHRMSVTSSERAKAMQLLGHSGY